MLNFIRKLQAKVHIFYIIVIAYFGFGVYSPTKMVYINDILMSYANIVMYFISNSAIQFTLYLRSILQAL